MVCLFGYVAILGKDTPHIKPFCTRLTCLSWLVPYCTWKHLPGCNRLDRNRSDSYLTLTDLWSFWIDTEHLAVSATAYILTLWLFNWFMMRCEFVDRKLMRHKAMCIVEPGRRGLMLLQLMLITLWRAVLSLVLQWMTYRNTVRYLTLSSYTL